MTDLVEKRQNKCRLAELCFSKFRFAFKIEIRRLNRRQREK